MSARLTRIHWFSASSDGGDCNHEHKSPSAAARCAAEANRNLLLRSEPRFFVYRWDPKKQKGIKLRMTLRDIEILARMTEVEEK